jgi:WD40 repeat protein/tetratricopeptide (TPR) repeat protein
MINQISADTGFSSLAALQAAHSRLQVDVRKEPSGEANIADNIAHFVRRAVLTGAKLDHVDDRRTAQAVINYWLSRAIPFSGPDSNSTTPLIDSEFDSLLADFEPETLAATTKEVDNWLAGNPADDAMARTIVLRLMRLRDDDTFEPVAATSSVYEDLEPIEVALNVVNKLAEVGIIRFDSDDSGRREITLRSFDLLQNWPRLREWEAKRREFRSMAIQWAHGTLHEQGKTSLKSAWDEAIRLWKPGDDIFADKLYDEAESYRDLNAVELKLVYQKRQADKEKRDRNSVLVKFFAGAFAVCLALAVLAVYQRRVAITQSENARNAESTAVQEASKAEEARKEADALRKERELQIASMQFSRGADLQAGEMRIAGHDVSGALLLFADGIRRFDKAVEGSENAEVYEQLRLSYRLSLGLAQSQVPTLASILYQPNYSSDGDSTASSTSSVATPSQDGNVVITVGVEREDGKLRLVCKHRQRKNSWKETSYIEPLDQQTQPTRLGLYVSPRGEAAAVAMIRHNNVAIRLFAITSEGGLATRLSENLEGTIVDAKFSPDAEHFGVVVANTDRRILNADARERSMLTKRASSLIVWSVSQGLERLNHSHEDGALLGLAFASRASGISPRVAAVLGSDSTNPGTICLEWGLDECDEESPTRYEAALAESTLTKSDDVELQSITYEPQQQQTLLFVARGRRNQFSESNVWLIDTRKKKVVQGPAVNGSVTAAAFNVWGDALAIGYAEGGVTISRLSRKETSLEGQQHIFTEHGHEGQVFRVEFSLDGRYLLSASRDRTAAVHDSFSGRLVHAPLGHCGSVTYGGFSPDGHQALTVCENGVYIWNLPWNVSRVLSIDVPSSEEASRIVTAKSFDEQSRVLVAGGRIQGSLAGDSFGWARVWDLSTGKQLTPEFIQNAAVQHVAVTSRAPLMICTTGSDGIVRLWNKDGKVLDLIEAEGNGGSDGQAILTSFGRHQGQLRLLVLGRAQPNEDEARSTLCIYGLDANLKLSRLSKVSFSAALTSAALNDASDQVVAYTGGFEPGIAVVWSAEDGLIPELLRRDDAETTHREPITHAVFSNDGNRLVTTGRDDKAIVWIRKNRSWQPQGLAATDQIGPHTADINYAAFEDADAKKLVTASADGRVIIWRQMEDDAPYRPIVQLKPETNAGGASKAEFIDGHFVLSSHKDGKIRLWDYDDSGGRLVSAKMTSPGAVNFFCSTNRTGGGQVLSISQANHHPRPLATRSAMSNENLLSSQLLVANWDVIPIEQLGLRPMRDVELMAARSISNRHPLRFDPLSSNQVFDIVQQSTFSFVEPSVRDLQIWHIREANECEGETPAHWHIALWHWNAVIADYPTVKSPVDSLASCLIRRARVHGKLENWESADRDFANALTHAANDNKTTVDVLQAWATTRRLRLKKATADDRVKVAKQLIDDYHRLLAFNDEDRITLAGLADAYREAEMPDKAIHELNKLIRADRPDPDLLRLRASAHGNIENREHKSAAYEDYLCAATAYKERQRSADAIASYRAAIKFFDETMSSEERSAAPMHAALGEVYASLGRFDEAAKEFATATKLNETEVIYWSGLARAVEMLPGDAWKEARAAYDKAVSLQTDDLALAISRGNYLVRLGSSESGIQSVDAFHDAAVAIQQIVDRAPDAPIHRLRLAAIHLLPGPPTVVQVEKAIDCLSKINWVSTSGELPEIAIARNRLAVLQLTLGRIDDYRATRDALLEVSTEHSIPIANSIAWTSAFFEGSPEVVGRAIALAERLNTTRNPSYLNTYGALLYRAHKFEEAIKQLEKATIIRAQTRYDDRKDYGDTLDLLFSAMAKYRLSEAFPARLEEAQADLKRALTRIDQMQVTPKIRYADDILERTWNRLEINLIRQEAEKLIKP